MKKIPAFSLMEITIVLLLSAIVMSMAFQGYQMFAKYYQIYQQKTLYVSEANRLQTTLQHYTFSCEKITSEQKQLIFHFPTKKIDFQFQEKYVLVNIHQKIDTFYCEIQDFQTFWKKQEQNITGKIIDEFSFRIIHEVSYFCFFRKEYDASTYFQLEE